MNTIITLLLVILVSYTSYGQQAIAGEPSTGELLYYCSPCGCANDGKYFGKSGTCEACNMVLQPTIIGLDIDRPTIPRPTIGILLFDGADVMDVSGPISVFEHAMFNIVTFAKTKSPVRIGMNLELQPDFVIDQLPEIDVLVLPGGGLAESDPADSAVIKLIHERKKTTKVLFSVCSGAFFLGEAGLLDGQRATTFAGLIPRLKQQYPKAVTLDHVKYVDNGQVVTSAGLSSGIDAAFQVVSKFYGVGRAQDIANHMEYPWKRENDYARSQLADGFAAHVRPLIALFSTAFYYSQGNHNQWEFRYKLTDKIETAEILKILKDELRKNNKWSIKSENKYSIAGTIEHDILGKGLMHILIDDAGKTATLTMKRLKPFNAVNP